YRVRAAYVSPYRRAMETAELALRGSGVPQTVLPELRELSLGQWEGCTVDDVRARDGDPYRAWLRAPHDCPPPDGEPLPDVHARVQAAVDHIAGAHPNGDDVLIVAHGGDQRLRVLSARVQLQRSVAAARGQRLAHRRAAAPPGQPERHWPPHWRPHPGPAAAREHRGHRPTGAMMVLLAMFGGTALLLYGI